MDYLNEEKMTAMHYLFDKEDNNTITAAEKICLEELKDEYSDKEAAHYRSMGLSSFI